MSLNRNVLSVRIAAVLLISAGALVATTSTAFAQTADDTMTMDAEILQALDLQVTTHLNFGRISLDPTLATEVVIAASDAAVPTTATGGAVVMTGTGAVGVFTIAGSNDATYQVTYTDNQALPDVGWTLVLDQSIAGASTQTLSATGTATGYVGGTLTIPNDTLESGAVSLGSLDIAVDYE